MARLIKILCLAAFLLLFLAGGVLFYAYHVEPGRLTVTEMDIPIREWDGTNHSLRVVLAGDFHLEPGGEARLKKIVHRMASLEPDLIVLVGDFCYGHTKESSMAPSEFADILEPLCRTIPTFSVLGNHDFYYGAGMVKRELERAGMTILDGKTIPFTKNSAALLLTGIPFNSKKMPPVPQADGTLPLVAVTHSPDEIAIVPASAAITLAGHTHGGQICLPCGYPLKTGTQLGPSYAYGMVDNQGKRLLITRGLGSSILPLRTFCPPEIMLLHLKPQKQVP